MDTVSHRVDVRQYRSDMIQERALLLGIGNGEIRLSSPSRLTRIRNLIASLSPFPPIV
jgi:hypothetical protein